MEIADLYFLLLCCSVITNIGGLILVLFYYGKYINERGINAYLMEKYCSGGEHNA